MSLQVTSTCGAENRDFCRVALRGCGVSCPPSRSSAYKLEEHSQQGLVKDGNRLWGGSSDQIRMASEVAECIHLDAGWMYYVLRIVSSQSPISTRISKNAWICAHKSRRRAGFLQTVKVVGFEYSFQSFVEKILNQLANTHPLHCRAYLEDRPYSEGDACWPIDLFRLVEDIPRRCLLVSFFPGLYRLGVIDPWSWPFHTKMSPLNSSWRYHRAFQWR